MINAFYSVILVTLNSQILILAQNKMTGDIVYMFFFISLIPNEKKNEVYFIIYYLKYFEGFQSCDIHINYLIWSYMSKYIFM